MPQLIAITTAGHYTETQRADLKVDVEQQMAGFDVHILILPPGAQLQQGWIPPLTAALMRGVPAQTGMADDALIAQSQAEQAEARGVGHLCGDQREVQHVDTDEPEPDGIPPHVYLYRNMLTDLQRLAPLGIDETNGQYAVAIDQLTPEQMQVPHINKQLVQMRDDMCDHATKVWDDAAADVLHVAVDDPGAVAENEIVKRC